MDRLAASGSRNAPRSGRQEQSRKTTNDIITMKSFRVKSNSAWSQDLERISFRTYSLIWDQETVQRCQISVQSANRAQASAMMSNLMNVIK